MKKMNDSVKYQLEKAEDALRTALSFSEKESVYVISAISKALMEIDNTMFAERIEAAAKAGNPSAKVLSQLTKKSEKMVRWSIVSIMAIQILIINMNIQSRRDFKRTGGVNLPSVYYARN